MKKIIAVLIALTLVLPALSGFAASDYENHWSKGYINYLKDNDISIPSDGIW